MNIIRILPLLALATVSCQSDAQPQPKAEPQPASPASAPPQLHPSQVPFTRSDAPAPSGELPAPRVIDPGVDVVGLKLGMSPSDALSALDQRVSAEGAQFKYAWVSFTDKADRIEGNSSARDDIVPARSDRHVSGISFSKGRDRLAERIGLTFALPPEPNVLIGIDRHTLLIRRDEQGSPKPEVTEADFVSALKEKYGAEPQIWNHEGGLSTGSGVWGPQLYKWSYPGPGQGDCKPFIQSAEAAAAWNAASTHAAVVKKFGFSYPRPEACATTLLAVVQPPSSAEWRSLGYAEKAEVVLSNPGVVYLNEKRHQAWAKQLKADWVAKARSQVQSAKPDL